MLQVYLYVSVRTAVHT